MLVMAAPAEPEKSYFARRNWKIFKDCEGPPKAPLEIINICLLLFHFQLNSTRRRRTRCYQNGDIKGVFFFCPAKGFFVVFFYGTIMVFLSESWNCSWRGFGLRRAPVKWEKCGFDFYDLVAKFAYDDRKTAPLWRVGVLFWWLFLYGSLCHFCWILIGFMVGIAVLRGRLKNSFNFSFVLYMFWIQ